MNNQERTEREICTSFKVPKVILVLKTMPIQWQLLINMTCGDRLQKWTYLELFCSLEKKNRSSHHISHVWFSSPNQCPRNFYMLLFCTFKSGARVQMWVIIEKLNVETAEASWTPILIHLGLRSKNSHMKEYTTWTFFKKRISRLGFGQISPT